MSNEVLTLEDFRKKWIDKLVIQGLETEEGRTLMEVYSSDPRKCPWTIESELTKIGLNSLMKNHPDLLEQLMWDITHTESSPEVSTCPSELDRFMWKTDKIKIFSLLTERILESIYAINPLQRQQALIGSLKKVSELDKI